MQHILYLHGFLSSPQSIKAQATKTYFEQHHTNVTLHIPELSNFPSKVERQLLEVIESTPALLENGLKLIGSSMGGYLSTFLLEKFGGKAVLINPAVRPYELLRNFIGAHENPYSKEKFEIVESDMGVIQALDAALIKQPSNYKVLLQTADETLDYRLAADKYAQSHLIIEEGGDHSFVGYENHLPAIAEFLLK
ncbi:esterase YqiA [Alteromonas sp. ALT199]|uniref:YqiA/YcfP family alpha/beta fold hydrolase n=1 Tax=unclassified Alteromonas TaxID=2614992 RepID=UPI0004478A7B|nr:YqiA/YcfP family alpha/beta fold hydrolase [Alteromonas sp. ALT199]MBT3135523.1 esterase YqiA [Alteromonas sp. ALT199]